MIEGIKQLNLPWVKYLRDDYHPFNPAAPDRVDTFKWNDSPFTEVENLMETDFVSWLNIISFNRYTNNI